MQHPGSTFENSSVQHSLTIPPTLTSWKEIAQYLGKGVRTVQRWEQTLHLPVRRPRARIKGVVLALPSEIDSWLLSRFSPNGESTKSELKTLREQLAELREENKALRRQLEQATCSGQTAA